MASGIKKESRGVIKINSKLSNSSKYKNLTSNLFKKYGIALAFIVTCICIAIITPNFLTGRNILNVIRQISLNGIVAIGLTFIILQGDIDLSVGSMAALSGVIATGLCVNQNVPVLIAVFIALLVCAALGLIMGFVITKANVHSFVVTLGMLSVARGMTMIYTNGYPISGLSDAFREIGSGTIWIIPLPVIFFILLAAIAYFVLTKTPFGRYIYAIGGNEEASRLSGINVKVYRMSSFAISSMLAAFAGVILAARVSSGQPTAAEGWELDAIAAVIIGGTSMSGGRGGIMGTIIGVLFLGVLRNGLNLMQVSPFYQKIFIGLLIVFAVVLDSVKKDK